MTTLTNRFLTGLLGSALLIATGCNGETLAGSQNGGSAGVAGTGQAGSNQAGSNQAGAAGSGQAGKPTGGSAGQPQAGAAGSGGQTGCVSPNTPVRVCVGGKIENDCYPPDAGAPQPFEDCGNNICVTGGQTCPGGKVCGGIQGLTCAPDEFCNFPAATQCGSGDQQGTCEKKPAECAEGCPAPEFQLCGCDGQKYCSECNAHQAGTSVTACPDAPKACGGFAGLTCSDTEYCDFPDGAKCGAADQQGVCKPRPEGCQKDCPGVCGCDGQKYCNSCEASKAGTDVTTCPDTPKKCGGFSGKQCAADEYCDFPDSFSCGIADGSGVCQKKPTSCDACTTPGVGLCGCDGQKYCSECVAHLQGVDTTPCTNECAPPSTPAKACINGQIQNICLGPNEGNVAPFEDCGNNTCVPGGQACPNPKVCGGLLGLTCDKDEFCNFPLDSQCGSGDQQGTCEKKPAECAEGCPAPEFQLCGCDGQKYCSECNAHQAGTSVTACSTTPKKCGGKMGLTCAASEYCDFSGNDTCGFADQQGECKPRPEVCEKDCPIVCGCDGQKYCNACLASQQGVDTQPCSTPPKTCGGLLGEVCAADEFCDYPDSSMCGAGDQQGVCQKKPTACDTSTNPGLPVCGCDGQKYCDACEAQLKGVDTTPCGQKGAGDECGSSDECGGGLLCCYPCGIPGCTNKCMAGDQNGQCPAFP